MLIYAATLSLCFRCLLLFTPLPLRHVTRRYAPLRAMLLPLMLLPPPPAIDADTLMPLMLLLFFAFIDIFAIFA